MTNNNRSKGMDHSPIITIMTMIITTTKTTTKSFFWPFRGLASM